MSESDRLKNHALALLGGPQHRQRVRGRWPYRLGRRHLAVGVNADGHRGVLGMDIGPSEAEAFRTAFLGKLDRSVVVGPESRP